MKLILHQALLNDEIISRREEMGLTQKQLATLCKISTNDIQILERLQPWSRHTKQALDGIAAVFNVDPHVLFPPWARERLTKAPTTVISKHVVPPAENLGMLVNMLPDPRTWKVNADQQEALDIVSKMIEDLPPSTKEIVTMYYGLQGYRRQTLERIGQGRDASKQTIAGILGIVEGRARQLLRKEGYVVPEVQFRRHKCLQTERDYGKQKEGSDQSCEKEILAALRDQANEKPDGTVDP